MAKFWGTVIAVLGALVMVLSGYAMFAGPAQVTGGPAITTTWAADTTCGYGFTAVDCWASNESLSLDGPAMTVTVKLNTNLLAINPDDIAFTLTVKNDGPPVYDAFGNEIPQPIYAQVTSISTIVSNQGVPLEIVQVNSLNQKLIAFRDFADNSFIVEQRQALLGTLAAGASDTAKMCIQLRWQAFSASTMAVGQTYYIRGFVGQHSFTASVYISALV